MRKDRAAKVRPACAAVRAGLLNAAAWGDLGCTNVLATTCAKPRTPGGRATRPFNSMSTGVFAPHPARAGNSARWRAWEIAKPIQRTAKIALDRDSGGALHQTKTSCSIKALEIPGRNGCKPPAARVTTNPTGSCDRDVRMSGGSEDGYREQPPFARRQQSIRQNDPGKGCMHSILVCSSQASCHSLLSARHRAGASWLPGWIGGARIFAGVCDSPLQMYS